MASERWIYGGVRATVKGRRHGWLDADGNEYIYNDKGSFVIGGIYAVEVDREDESLSRSKPVYTGDRIEDEQRIIELDVKDIAARTSLAQRALEKRHAEDHAIAEALAPLEGLVIKTRTSAERDALAAYCMRIIYGGYR